MEDQNHGDDDDYRHYLYDDGRAVQMNVTVHLRWHHCRMKIFCEFYVVGFVDVGEER